MTKVLHLNCNYMTTALHQTMIRHLNKYTDNTIFCPIRKGRETIVNPDENVIVSECFRSIDRAFYFKKQGLILREIEKKCNVETYDIIHAYTLFTDGNCAMRLSKKYHKPFVVAVRDTDINDFFKWRPYLIGLGKEIMKNAEAVLFLSESYMNRMLSYFKKGEERDSIAKKMHVIPNGMDPFWIDNIYNDRCFEQSTKRINEKILKVVCVGQIIKRKNIPYIVEALDILRKEGWKVHIDIIGNATDKKQIAQIIKYDFVSYFPPVCKEELLPFYRDNDLFILVSHAETFGLVYPEAMSQGLPVIYTRGQGFDGHFKDGFIGYSSSDKKIDDLVNCIKLLCTHYKECSQNCIKGSLQFNWKDIVFNYNELYLKIMGKQ